jgi:hypothetical protein
MSSQNKGALNRLNTVNNHMKVVKAKKKAYPTLNVWEHMNLDQYLTEKGANCRKRVSKVMSENIEELN